MLIFIDESGDAGFKIEKGSSRYFVIVLVIFDDDLDAEETALEIKKLKRKFKKSDQFEFKFNKMTKDQRIKFLNTIKDNKFRVRAIVFDKENLHSLVFKTSKDKFYNYAIKIVLEKNNNTIRNAKLRLDGLGKKTFKKEMNVYLRQNLNKNNFNIIKNLKFEDSKENVLIQLADMIAGSVKRSYETQYLDHKVYKKIIVKKIEDLWEFK